MRPFLCLFPIGVECMRQLTLQARYLDSISWPAPIGEKIHSRQEAFTVQALQSSHPATPK